MINTVHEHIHNECTIKIFNVENILQHNLKHLTTAPVIFQPCQLFCQIA